MDTYWFTAWLMTHRVRDEASLQKALSRPRAIDSLLESSPPPVGPVRDEPPDSIELTGARALT
jgi:hypothetical protein